MDSRERIKTLFIAYYFYPFPGVGAKRISYWARYIKEESHHLIDPYVLTGTGLNEDTEELYEAKRLVPRIKYLKTPFFWNFLALQFIIKNYSKFDVAIISGGPFITFVLVYILKLLGIKVILDYRDPYANNPLHKIGPIKMMFKKFFEYFVNLPADYLITVNRYCKELIVTNKRKNFYLIDNGFDEKEFSNLKFKDLKNKKSKPNSFSIGYAGKLSQGRSIVSFMESMHKAKINFTFEYVGPDVSEIPKDKFEIIDYGVCSYRETLSILSNCDFCLLLYGGYPFESSTKIFDYIGMKKPIIIYKENKNYDFGAVYDILKNYEPHFFFDDTIKELSLKVNQDLVEQDVIRFSRSSGLKRLIDLIKEL